MAQYERTLVLLKPDAVQRGLIGEILTRYEKRGLRIAAMKLATVTEAQAREHYAEHVEKGFFPGLLAFITSGPSVQLILEGPDAIQVVRDTNGATNPVKAVAGTIRADFGLTTGRNLVHASDGPEAAAREIGIFFGDGGTIEYTRVIDEWIVELD